MRGMHDLLGRASDAIGLPRDVVLALPRITLMGREWLMIENHRGIVGYDQERLRIATCVGILCVSGERLMIERIGGEDIVVHGDIVALDFIE